VQSIALPTVRNRINSQLILSLFFTLTKSSYSVIRAEESEDLLELDDSGAFDDQVMTISLHVFFCGCLLTSLL